MMLTELEPSNLTKEYSVMEVGLMAVIVIIVVQPSLKLSVFHWLTMGLRHRLTRT